MNYTYDEALQELINRYKYDEQSAKLKLNLAKRTGREYLFSVGITLSYSKMSDLFVID